MNPESVNGQFRQFITTVGYGSAIIRAQSKDGNHIAECTVNVTIATPNPGISKDPNPNILYESHIENIGWGNFGKDGSSSGTTGRCLRLEGIKINLFGNSNLNIEYQTHVQDIGWMNYVRNGEMSGTEGQAKRLEAIRIKLTGSDAEKFDVCYRVHAQDVGWMNWAKNDQAAGTAGFARRLEAIQIVIVPKGSQPPVLNPSNNTDAAFIQK